MLESDLLKINLMQRREGLEYRVRLFEKIDSTNLEAVRSYHNEEDLSDKTVFLSRAQSKGKGQLYHKWYSPKNNIYMTIFLKPKVCISNLSKLTLMTGMSLCKTLQRISGIPVRLKRPNDVVIQVDDMSGEGDYRGLRKLAGILSKSSFCGNDLEFVIIGLGLNVNVEVFPDELSNLATSMSLEAGKKFDLNMVFVEILKDFEKYYEMFIINQDEFIKEYGKLTVN